MHRSQGPKGPAGVARLGEAGGLEYLRPGPGAGWTLDPAEAALFASFLQANRVAIELPESLRAFPLCMRGPEDRGAEDARDAGRAA